MGCCLGTTAVKHRQPAESKPKTAASQSPPPAFEEETVKEVLSETPIVPKNPPPAIVDHVEIIQQEECKCESGAVDLTKTPTVESQENVSEMSEMYSYSESFSAATTATTLVDTKKDEIEMDDDDEVTQKVKSRSPPAKRVPRKRPVLSSGELAGRKEGGTRPLARRQTAPSPEKKRQSPSRTTTNSQRYRNVGPSGDARREGTARRSRSPAMRGETGQRGKVREISPAMKSSEDVIPVKVVASEEKSTVEMADDGGVSPELEPELQPPESLENPLVSLECFIFL